MLTMNTFPGEARNLGNDELCFDLGHKDGLAMFVQEDGSVWSYNGNDLNQPNYVGEVDVPIMSDRLRKGEGTAEEYEIWAIQTMSAIRIPK